MHEDQRNYLAQQWVLLTLYRLSLFRFARDAPIEFTPLAKRRLSVMLRGYEPTDGEIEKSVSLLFKGAKSDLDALAADLQWYRDSKS